MIEVKCVEAPADRFTLKLMSEELVGEGEAEFLMEFTVGKIRDDNTVHISEKDMIALHKVTGEMLIESREHKMKKLITGKNNA